MYHAAAHSDRGGAHHLRGKQMQQIAYPGHIHYRIQGSNLVKVDLAYIHPVRLRFRLGDKSIGAFGTLPYCLRQRKAIDHGLNIHQRVMLVVVMLMMAVMSFLLSMDRHPHMGTGNPLPPDGLRLQPHAG